ncbi:MAG: hypothetical protein RI952_1536 [Bacteroidota bacterium]|jgi:hypothetical protein
MSTTTIDNKPQVAIDMGLLTRSEAAEYMGLSPAGFARIAPKINGKRIGLDKFYSPESIRQYLANIQQPVLKTSQPVEN